MQYMKDGFSQNLVERQEEIDSRLEKYILREKEKEKEKVEEKMLSLKTRWMRLYALRSLLHLDDVRVKVDIDPLFSEILLKAKARVEAWGGQLYFVYLPGYEHYRKKGISHDNYSKKYEVIDVVRGLGIQVIDIHREVFADHPDPLSLFPFRLHGHYNKEGYSEVAKAVIAAIKQ